MKIQIIRHWMIPGINMIDQLKYFHKELRLFTKLLLLCAYELEDDQSFWSPLGGGKVGKSLVMTIKWNH
jgi:hypothetical protein